MKESGHLYIYHYLEQCQITCEHLYQHPSKIKNQLPSIEPETKPNCLCLCLCFQLYFLKKAMHESE
jgi:hypothetical protein